jgi:hypothetical protein
LAEQATFSELVREAFIDPLRSVLIIDDEYPTWEEILNSHMSKDVQNVALEERSSQKPWRREPNSPLGVIKEFRSRKPGFVIDIHDALATSSTSTKHDGDNLETAGDLADHLHQSDLLVLDYNLEGDKSGLGGKKAREILQYVLTNNHFNLIIVHTGEDNLTDVMSECLIALMHSCTSELRDEDRAKLDELDEKICDLEDAEEFDRSQIKDVFTVDSYLEARRIGTTNAVRRFMNPSGPFSRLNELGRGLGLPNRCLKTFFLWAIKEFEKARLGDFSRTKTPDGLVWNIETGTKWMRTTRGFVSFVKKGPDDLLEELQNGLENWKPTPSRLLSAKFRHVINSSGVEAEDRSLLKNYVFAHFYKSICAPAPAGMSEVQAELSRAFKLKDHVARQSESISLWIEDQIVEFGERIIEADNVGDNDFAAHYGIDLNKESEEKTAVAQYNNYVSTLPLKNGGDQLDSGHVFKLGGDWWVCATPACDLQPGQTSIAFKGASDDLRPFTALKLVKIKPEDFEKEHINSGSYCFVEEEGKIVGLGLRSLREEEKPATQKVTWRTFVAKDGGLISGRSFKVFQLELGANEINTIEAKATLVAKLRYQYALNYIQRVGTSVSRIGLDYAAFSGQEKAKGK